MFSGTDKHIIRTITIPLRKILRLVSQRRNDFSPKQKLRTVCFVKG